MARRQLGRHGFDRGGGRRSFFKSRWTKIFFAVGLVGIVGSLVPLLIIGNNSTPSGPAGVVVDAPVRRLPTTLGENIGAVEGKPTFDAPPPFTLDPSKNYEAILTLEDGGTVRIQLFDDIAPVHVNNFLFLVNQQYYDDLTFHRVVPDFVAQAGDPTATSSGNAGYVLPDEEVAGNGAALTLGDSGIIAMARSGAGVSSSQFFITLSPQPQLDALGFTAFGKVVEGMELVQELPARDPQELPQPPAGARITSIRIEVTDAAASADTSTPESPDP